MAFASASRRVVEKYTVPMTNSGTAAVAITPEWTIPNVLHLTPRDIASDSGIIFQGTGAVEAPTAYSPRPISSVQVLGHGLRASADLRVRVDPGAGQSDNTAFFLLALPDLGTFPLLISMVTDVSGGGTNAFRLAWGSTTVTTTPTWTDNTWHRVGWEILPEENVVRAYFNTTNGAQGEAANAALAVQSSVTLTGAGEPLTSSPYFVGCSFSGGSNIAPGDVGEDFTGITDIIVELFEIVSVAPIFPTGAIFQSLNDDPYAIYKTTMTLHAMLNNARLL